MPKNSSLMQSPVTILCILFFFLKRKKPTKINLNYIYNTYRQTQSATEVLALSIMDKDISPSLGAGPKDPI